MATSSLDYTSDQDRVRWPGKATPVIDGCTPMGYFERDPLFCVEAPRAINWAAYRLGYPTVDLEMDNASFYACFEDAISEYSSQVNQFNIINNIGLLAGQSTNINITQKNVQGTGLPYLIRLGQAYGTEVGVGGLVDWKRGKIEVHAGTQSYDLQSEYGNPFESGSRIEIKKVYHYAAPASARIYDPFSMTGMSYTNVLNEFGFAGYSPATQFLMTPFFEDALRMQAIEFNDTFRKSGWSFNIVNNKLQIFPIPLYDFSVYFDYVISQERDQAVFTASGSYYTVSGSSSTEVDEIGDYSNVPYDMIPYAKINSVGRQWIKKYFLANAKESLGIRRQKYQTVPIPGGEISLDGGELRSEAMQEKEKLITELRENLTATSRKSQMEQRVNEANQLQEAIRKVPLFIYVR